MNLKDFLTDLPRGGVANFAAKCGIASSYLHQLSARQHGREPSPELCVVIERESGLKVTRQDLRPTDWQAIWPELATPKRSKKAG